MTAGKQVIANGVTADRCSWSPTSPIRSVPLAEVML